jgi:hypothetical protein
VGRASGWEGNGVEINMNPGCFSETAILQKQDQVRRMFKVTVKDVFF